MSKAHRVQTLKVNLLDTGENLLGNSPASRGRIRVQHQRHRKNVGFP